MKTLQLAIAVILAFCISLSSYSQAHDQNQMNMSAGKTESFKVLGNCNMCKARIEKAARAEGVTAASWDEKSQLLTVSITREEFKGLKNKGTERNIIYTLSEITAQLHIG